MTISKKELFAWICVFFAAAQNLTAQTKLPLPVLEDSIAHFAAIAVRDTNSLENRLEAQQKLIPLIKTALNTSKSFDYTFQKVDAIAIQYPQDRSFRVWTWQVMRDSNHYDYYGFIQTNQARPRVFELKNAFKNVRQPESAVLSADQWLGGLIYSIRQFKDKDGGMRYILFTYNAGDLDEKTKIAEVLSLRGGTPRFGAPVFVGKVRGREIKQNRLFLPYSADANVRLNFDPSMNMIVHDHLTPTAARNPNMPSVNIPDGTYEAFIYEKGIWKWIEKLPNQVLDKPPGNGKQEVKRAKIVNQEDTKDFDWPDDVKKREKKQQKAREKAQQKEKD